VFTDATDNFTHTTQVKDLNKNILYEVNIGICKGEWLVVEAFILVKIATQTVESGYNRSVVEKICRMKCVENVQLLFGDYDAIVKLNAPKIHDVENTVIEEISMITGVESTVTLLCVDERILE